MQPNFQNPYGHSQNAVVAGMCAAMVLASKMNV